MKPLQFITAGTRRLQARYPRQPIRGYSRLSSLLGRALPPFEGVVQLPDGVSMRLDTHLPAERMVMVSGLYQPALANLLQQHTAPGAYCLDLGANIGFFTLKLAHWAGPQGRVAAFEANPQMATRVRHNVALNDQTWVDVVNRPVDRQARQATFYLAANPGKSSLLATQVTAPVDVLTVQTLVLDDYLDAQGWDRLDVIKSDIEGNDCNALLGAQKALARFKPLIVLEFWYRTSPEIAREYFEFLESLEYTFQVLSPYSTHEPFDWQHLPQPDARLRKHVDVICTPPA